MARIPKNHNGLYFDTLVRTQKMESVLSLIHATYHAKRSVDKNANIKEEIAKRLENSYNLFRDNPKGTTTGSGSYNGDISQFDSQYTIGHELCIWKNSNLDLTPMATKVAENIITIRDYFDVVFFNYFQPVDNVAVHPVYCILKYMSENGTIKIAKSDIPKILNVSADNEDINALCNFLDGTHYFRLYGKELKFVGKTNPTDYIKYCNTKYIGKEGYELAKIELGNEDKYIDYLTFSVYDNERDLEIVSRKELFRNWMLRKKKSNGEPYAPGVIKDYIYGLTVISKILNIDIFSITGADVLRELKIELDTNNEYIEENKKLNNKSSAGLSQYIEFSENFHEDENDIYQNLIESTPLVIEESNDILYNEKHRGPRVNPLFPLNFILYGAPGTGKTYSTIEYALSIIKNKKPDLEVISIDQRKDQINEYKKYASKGQICFVTFHQNYTYEDFIQGLKPDISKENLRFINNKGVFMDISERAQKDPDNNYVIILDEINRGNISKIFGELITLIEDDKRLGELNGMELTLSSGECFSVPNNLYIIGTMNTADKSISLLDIALRRRFSFIEVPPNVDIITNLNLKKILRDLNDFLRNELKGTDMLIGHSYFMNKNEKDVITIFNNNIIPLLYEYFYDDEIKVKRALNKSLGENWVIDDTSGRVKIKSK
ncbi:MAG: AAA family ATPase [Acholeplasma sp.]|nr:AAA family ATPase [Acholeplasma sp.]